MNIKQNSLSKETIDHMEEIFSVSEHNHSAHEDEEEIEHDQCHFILTGPVSSKELA